MAHDRKAYEAERTRREKNTARGRLRRLVSRARKRAQALGLPFDLSYTTMEMPSHCPVLGIELGFVTDTPLDNRPSIDRLVPALGYTTRNTRIISFRANTLKNGSTAAELRAILTYMEAHELSA